MAGLFGDTQYQVQAVTRAGRGRITIGDYAMLAVNIQINFAQEPQLRPLADGKVFATVSMPQGQLQVGAVAGPGATNLVEASNDIGNLLSDSENQIVVDMSDPTMQTAAGETDLDPDLEFTLSQYVVQSFQVQSETENPPVMTQIQIFFVDMSDSTEATTSTI